MAVRLILNIGSFFFLVLLLTALFSKKVNMKLYNKIYIRIIILVILIIITESFSFLINVYTDYNIIGKLLLKINWLNIIVMYFYINIYIYLLIKDIDYNSIKDLIRKNNYCKFFMIFSIVILIANIFIPFSNINKEEYDFLPGLCSYIIIGYIFINNLTLLYILLKNKNNNQRKVKIIVALLFLIFGVYLLFQLLFRNIAFLGLVNTIEIFILFFIIENPDIRLTKEIDSLKNVIEKSSKSKSDFLSNMSHEIRSPMNAIIGFSDTSYIDPNNYDKEKLLSDINHIKSSSKNLLDIINNILDISKIESGTDTIDNREYSLKNLVIDWSSIVETRLNGKNIKFMLEIDSNIPNNYYGDSTKIYQIVLNLLTNAIKYTEVGRIRMIINSIKIDNENYKLSFKVSDTGFGIKDEEKSLVFEKFSRLDNATTNEIEGTGLGLVLSKRYAELMGGSLTFDSDYGVGSTFYLEVPQKIINEIPIGNINESIIEENNKVLLDCSGLKALLVDDDELTQRVVKRIFSAYKLEVKTLSNAKDCLYTFKIGEHFDIIFLDHFMEGMDGVTLQRAIKRIQGYYIPPIVVLTANAVDGVREMYLKEGFDEYLSKPIDLNELDRVINKFLRRK